MTAMQRVVINGKWGLDLPLHRASRPEWYTEKGWERKRLDSMFEHLGKEDTVFYVGSEEGEMPALCHMWGAKVFMFEPNDKVWPNTKAIWDANTLTPPLGCFVGFASSRTTPGLVVLNAFPECADGPVISDHGFMNLLDEGAPQIRIDDLVGETKLVPTALSIDVEGSEWEVLKGAELTIKTLKPKIWLSLHPEFLFDKYKKYSYEVRRWLIEIGYREQLLEYEHECHLFYRV